MVQTVFEADPRHWQSGAIRSRLGNPGDIDRLPFLRAKVQNVEMDLGVLEKSQATYMEFNAGGVVCDDLRLAYSKIMTEYEVYHEDEFQEMPDVSCSNCKQNLLFGLSLLQDIWPLMSSIYCRYSTHFNHS